MAFGKKDVVALTGLTYRQVDHWATTGVVRPSIKTAAGKGSRREYSFQDLVQLRVAKALRDGGISVQKMRKALSWLRRHFPEKKSPLAELRLVTDGSNIFIVDRNLEKIVDSLKQGQLVFSLALGEIIEGLKGELRKLSIPSEEKVCVEDQQFTVILTPDLVDDFFTAECREIPNSNFQGETEQKALDNILEALEERVRKGLTTKQL